MLGAVLPNSGKIQEYCCCSLPEYNLVVAFLFKQKFTRSVQQQNLTKQQFSIVVEGMHQLQYSCTTFNAKVYMECLQFFHTSRCCCCVVVVIVVSFKYLLVREPKVPAISLDHICMEKFIESTHSALDRTGMIVQEWTQKYPLPSTLNTTCLYMHKCTRSL